MAKELSKKQTEILVKLGIETIEDLREYVLTQYLELMQSEKPEIKMQALKEMSRYLFNTSGACIILGNDLKSKGYFS